MENSYNPLISVIIPVYNVEKYLHECVDSVINQTYENIEVLLIDDGSTDKSPIICDEYAAKDKRIKVIHKENGGVSSARNKGIDISNGEYITFLDADDYLLENYIMLMIHFINDNEDSLIKYKGSKSLSIEKYCLNKVEKNKLLLAILKWENSKFSDSKFISSVVGSFYKSKIIKENKLYFDNYLIMGEDMIFNINYLTYINSYIVIPFDQYYIRTDNISITRSRNINIVIRDKYFHEILLKKIKRDYQELENVAINRSPLGGIICCCNSYYFNSSFFEINNSIKELDKFLKTEPYKTSLKKFSLLNSEYLTKAQCVYLFMLKYKCYLIAFFIKKIFSH